MKLHWIIITLCSERWGAVRLHLICRHATSIIWCTDYDRLGVQAERCSLKKLWYKGLICGYKEAWHMRQEVWLPHCVTLSIIWGGAVASERMLPQLYSPPISYAQYSFHWTNHRKRLSVILCLVKSFCATHMDEDFGHLYDAVTQLIPLKAISLKLNFICPE